MTHRSERSSLAGALSGLGWPLVFGLAACSGFYVLVFRGPLDSAPMHRYFASHPVSFCATAMFFVGLAALCLKLVDVWGQSLSLSRVGLDLSPDEASTVDDCPRLLDKLEQLPRRLRQSHLARRLHEALDYVDRRGSAAQLDDELKYLADVDAARQQESFSLVRIIIWATPMLGFLGTVIGITRALGDLGTQSELLATDPKTAMQALLSGLYVAFDTTALALSLSIVLMFVQFLVDRLETHLLAAVDQRTGMELVGCFRDDRDDEPHLAAVQKMADFVLQTAEQLVRQQTEHWRTTIEQANAKWNQLLEASSQRVRTALTESLDQSLNQLADRLAKVSSDTDQQMRNRWEQWQTALSDNARLLHSQQQELVRQGEVMTQVLQATGDVVKLEDALNHNLRALAGSQNFEETVMSLAAAIHLLNARLGQRGDDAPRVELGNDSTQGRAA